MLPWSFGAFVLLTMLLDLSGGTMAREVADWMSAVRQLSRTVLCFELDINTAHQ